MLAQLVVLIAYQAVPAALPSIHSASWSSEGPSLRIVDGALEEAGVAPGAAPCQQACAAAISLVGVAYHAPTSANGSTAAPGRS